jgi:hypothetical protein
MKALEDQVIRKIRKPFKIEQVENAVCAIFLGLAALYFASHVWAAREFLFSF